MPAPGPTAMLGKEPEEAQVTPAEEMLPADPKKGHSTDPVNKCWIPGAIDSWIHRRSAEKVPLTRTPHSRR